MNPGDSRAPDFTLPGSDGKTHSLKDYAGKTIVLFFYPKDDTPGCTKEACKFRDLHPEIAKRAVVLGVSKDGLDAHGDFIAKYKLPFVLLSDPETSVLKAYGAWGEKMSYGQPVMGTIRSTVIIGPDGRILRHWPRIADAETHPEEVLAFLSSN